MSLSPESSAETTQPAKQPLPRYACHKEVQAVQIKHVVFISGVQGYLIHPMEPGISPIAVPCDWQDKHGAKPGGYFVRYKDGYESFSPARAFEEGYTRVQP